MARYRRPKRNQKAQVMGVAALMLAMGGVIMAVLFLMNVGTAMYLTGKLGFVAQETARYTFGLSRIDDQKAREFARELITKMGMDAGSVKVSVAATQLNGADAVKATVTNSMSIFGKAEWLPKTVSVSNSAVSCGNGLKILGYLHVKEPTSESFSDPAPGAGWANYGVKTNGHYLPIIKPASRTQSISGSSTFEEIPSSMPVARLVKGEGGDIQADGGPPSWNARTGYDMTATGSQYFGPPPR